MHCAGKKLSITSLELDLSDLASIRAFAQKVQHFLGDRKLNALVKPSALHCQLFKDFPKILCVA